MNGDAEKPESRGIGRPWWEFEDVFGPLTGVGLEDELADLENGPPWQPVADGEPAGLLSAYREARARAEEVRAALIGAGLTASELPELCASLDGEGRGVVRVGAVSIETAARLVKVLRAGPTAPNRAA